MATRSDLTTRLRLASGLVLMTFVATHLINHAPGIHSLAAMEVGRMLFLAVWRSAPGTLLLYGALACHIALVVHNLYRRRTLRMPPWEMAQIVLGLLIPFWLVVHLVGTRGVHELYGVDDSYAYELDVLWPEGAWRQSTMVLIVWLHGCIGVHFWLRLRPWYGQARPWLLVIAVLLPTLSLIGFADGGREVRAGRHRSRLAPDRGRGRRLAVRCGEGLGLRGRGAGSERLRPAARDDRRRARSEAPLVPLRRASAAALSRRHGGRHRVGHERARGEPLGRRPARVGMRRPRPLLDLPRAGRRWRRQAAAAGAG